MFYNSNLINGSKIRTKMLSYSTTVPNNHCQSKGMYDITIAVACYVRAKHFSLVAKTLRSTLSSKKFQMQNLIVSQ